MMRFWIGTALLAGSWLLGLDYFYPASPLAWLATVAAAVLLLGTWEDADSCFITPTGRSPWASSGGAILLLLPAVWFAPWPYRAAPLLMVVGLGLQLLPAAKRSACGLARISHNGGADIPVCQEDLDPNGRQECLPHQTRGLAQGAMTAGVVLLVQALALEAYANQTARSHELPWPLPDMLAGIAGLLGIDAAADGSNVVMHSMRQVHRLAATWELLFDPATFCFFIGGATLLALAAWANLPPGRRWLAWLRGLRALTLLVAAWLPLRAGIVMAMYVHRVLRSDAERPLYAMNHFFSPWSLLLLLAPLALLAWRFVRWPTAEAEEPAATEDAGALAAGARLNEPVFAAGLIAVAIALFTAAIYWDPVGERKDGRVLVVERHSTWEPTTRPYDTTWFGEPSGYNYAAIYDYLGQFFEMSRLLESDKIDDAALKKCDVLVVKTPTARYSPDEVEAVQRFVERGGGLLLIGDHTNYERSSTIMNDITRPMGFIFRDDLLFSFEESPYDQLYVKPPAPHPIVQNLPPMEFAVSCSIDPGFSRGRPAIVDTRLWSMGPEYHYENFHPIPQHCPEMRYGAFVQVWAARYGQGRAVAYADSTVFSNFCVFQPGHSEMMLGMVEWLNHGNPLCDPRPWLILLGAAPLVAGIWLARGRNGAWIVLLAAGTCGWVAASLAVNAAHRWAMPPPECLRPQVRVVVDRTTSSAPLSKGAYIHEDGEGYGLLEQWIARLGCYTVRQEGEDAFSGDVLVVLCPNTNKSVTPEFREQLTRYVAEGGRLLVVDSPENIGSTAYSLLSPFGLAVHHDRSLKGTLALPDKRPGVDVEQACGVVGGRPLVWLDKLSVAATAQYGKGAVMAIGFGSLWNDKRMGETWMMEPQPDVKARYDVLFSLLRPLIEGKPLPAVPLAPEKPTEKAPDLPMKESGPAECVTISTGAICGVWVNCLHGAFQSGIQARSTA